jgi:DNA polymerase I-like protein with 3'-5' exonuclease and polymerase domains
MSRSFRLRSMMARRSDSTSNISLSDIPTKSDPIGYSIWRPERKEGYYVPFNHEPGGNLPREEAIFWLQNELRDRDVYGLNTKAEMHMLQNLNVDPDLINCRPHDIAFAAALLDEYRYSKDSRSRRSPMEYLPEGERKIHPSTVAPEHFYLSHPGEISDRAVSDAQLAWRVHEVTDGKIKAESLDRVLALEDSCILPVVEMERNGALIDRPKLERWLTQIDNRIERNFNTIWKETGLAVNPNKAGEMQKLFDVLGLEKPTSLQRQARRL